MSDIYVSIQKGKKKAAGTKDAPYKFLWMVINKVLKDGDTIHLAEGRYRGQSKKGIIPTITKKDVKILAGYSLDFSERKPHTYLTVIGPGDIDGVPNHTTIKFNGAGNYTLDGICIDRGDYCCYYGEGPPGANKKIEGFKDNTPFGWGAMNRKTSGSCPSVEIMTKGDITIKNCVILNSAWWGIYAKGGANIVIENNLILGFQGRGIEALGTWGKPKFTIKNNTIAFGNSLKTTEGRGISINPRKDSITYDISKNVIAFMDGGGITQKFKGSDGIEINDNTFWFCRRADYNEGAGTGTCNADEFEDELEFDAEDNEHKIPSFLAFVSKDWFDRYSQNGFVDMIAGNFNSDEQLMKSREVLGLKEFHLVGYKDTYPSYSKLPKMRPKFNMSRYPTPYKKGEKLDWAQIIQLIGKDGGRGVQKN